TKDTAYRIRNGAERLLIKYHTASMSLALRWLEYDSHALQPVSANSDRRVMESAIDHYDAAENLLRPYFGAARWPRYKCYLRCHRARLHYLGIERASKAELSDAYKLLNEAQAAVSQPANPSERTALAVSHLFLAELNIANARYKITDALRERSADLAAT